MKFRMDKKEFEGHVQVAWAIDMPEAHPIWRQYLLLAYDLRDDPGEEGYLRHFKEATHEFVLLAVDPDTVIDFDQDVFDQSHLVPLDPPNLGYQVHAATDAAFQKRLQECVEDMQHNRLSPDTDHRWKWDELFADGFSLVRQVEVPSLAFH